MPELRAFRAVYERRSFAAAAASLAVDPSVVSRRIRGLEKRLDVALFARNTRTVTPTPPADAFYPRVVEALTTLAEAQSELASWDGVLRGKLRVSAPAELGRIVVGPALHAFLDEHPGVQADLLLGDARIDLLRERIDLALRVGVDPPETAVVRRLGDSPQVVVASPAYLARNPGPGHALVLRSDRGQLIDIREHAPEALRPSLSIRMVTDDLRACYDATVAGVGVSALPLWLARSDLATGRLRELGLPRFHGVTTYLELPAGRRTHAVARAFIEALADHWAATMGGPVVAGGSGQREM
jgi:DNA-binding transcriptional LysR family regulator